MHPSIGFEFEAPPGFRLLNGERAVTGFGPDGAKMYFDMARIEPVRSLRHYLHRDWAAGTRLRRYQRTSVDEMDAVTAITRSSSGQPVRLAAIRFRGDSVARFVFVPAGAPRSDLDRRQRTTVFWPRWPERAYMDILKNVMRSILRRHTSRWMTTFRGVTTNLAASSRAVRHASPGLVDGSA